MDDSPGIAPEDTRRPKSTTDSRSGVAMALFNIIEGHRGDLPRDGRGG